MTKREWQLAIPLLIGIALCLAAFGHGYQVADPDAGIAALRVFQTQQGERVSDQRFAATRPDVLVYRSAKPEDFRVATQTLYRWKDQPSGLDVRFLPARKP